MNQKEQKKNDKHNHNSQKYINTNKQTQQSGNNQIKLFKLQHKTITNQTYTHLHTKQNKKELVYIQIYTHFCR